MINSNGSVVHGLGQYCVFLTIANEERVQCQDKGLAETVKGILDYKCLTVTLVILKLPSLVALAMSLFQYDDLCKTPDEIYPYFNDETVKGHEKHCISP